MSSSATGSAHSWIKQLLCASSEWRRCWIGALALPLAIVACDGRRADPPPVFQNPPLGAADCRSQMIVVNSQRVHKLKAGGDTFALTVTLSNLGQRIWADFGDRPLRLGIAWFPTGKTDKAHLPNFGEQRIPLPDIIVPGDTVDLRGSLGPVAQPGDYEAWIGPVQEGVAWCWSFDDQPLKVQVHVVE